MKILRYAANAALGALCVCSVFAADSSQTGLRALAQATAAALQADAGKAVNILKAVEAQDFAGDEQVFRDCMFQRFGEAVDGTKEVEVREVFVRDVMQAYRTYWRRALLDPGHRSVAEQQLLVALRKLLEQNSDTDFDQLEPILKQRLARNGYMAILGRTQPLQELMLWSRQEGRTFQVELPQGSSRAVRVTLLDDFASLGWSDYASCHRSGTGGWADAEGLYAVLAGYPGGVDSEDFRVSLLAHEAQHVADLSGPERLLPWELEYRAKLVEITLAERTQAKLLAKFSKNQADDPNLPHSFANRRLLQALGQRLGLVEGREFEGVEPSQIRAAARRLLQEDTVARFQARGPS